MSQLETQTTQMQRPDYNSTAEYYASRGIVFPTAADVDPSSVALSDNEISTMIADGDVQAFHDRRRGQELIDALFNDEKPTDSMIVFARHASECVRSATDSELTKQVLHFMGPIAYQPGITPELLHLFHTMMIEAYFYGRERMIEDAYRIGNAVTFSGNRS